MTAARVERVGPADAGASPIRPLHLVVPLAAALGAAAVACLRDALQVDGDTCASTARAFRLPDPTLGRSLTGERWS